MTTEETKMNAVSRVDFMHESPELVKKLMEFGNTARRGSLEDMLRDLVHIRASQINGCAFCLDMHVKEARLHGERELRLYHLSIWRESTLFSARERAALTWTEALTKLPEHGVSDALYEAVRQEMSPKELSDLTFEIMLINAWNRLNIGFQTTPGSADAVFGLDKAGLN